jgi:hypothetical protein
MLRTHFTVIFADLRLKSCLEEEKEAAQSYLSYVATDAPCGFSTSSSKLFRFIKQSVKFQPYEDLHGRST